MRTLTLDNDSWEIDEAGMLGLPGGFGQVHPGLSPSGQQVAIKVFHSVDPDDHSRELEFAAGFAGRGTQYVVPILDYGIDSTTGKACIVMLRADRNLRAWVAGQAVDEASAIAVMSDIVQGLIEAGDWIHRDLKPENVLHLDGRWQLVDFGIARLANARTATVTHKLACTPTYAAPEQFTGEHATHATDIYALGCIGFELLMRTPPFPGPNFEDFARQHQMDSPQVTKGSAGLRVLLHEMLAKSQRVRPTGEQIIGKLRALLAPGLRRGRGAALLAQAAVQVSELKAREEAAEHARMARERERKLIAEHAEKQMEAIAATFCELLQQTGAEVIEKRASCEARLGGGQLELKYTLFGYIAPETFRLSGWDVILGGRIGVRGPGCDWSASLWYAPAEDGTYRWMEVAYLTLGGSSPWPHFFPPGDEADIASSKAVSPYVIHHACVIDGDELNEFYDRWMELLAKAATGTLVPP